MIIVILILFCIIIVIIKVDSNADMFNDRQLPPVCGDGGNDLVRGQVLCRIMIIKMIIIIMIIIVVTY